MSVIASAENAEKSKAFAKTTSQRNASPARHIERTSNGNAYEITGDIW
jgi:hypothetical protein